MGLARAAGLPVVVVTDIDRGGSFAALYGTVALLEPADQALIAGFVINKFRGARELLDPGLDMITGLTGRPVLGVLPWAPGLWLDAEDSLALESRPGAAGDPLGHGTCCGSAWSGCRGSATSPTSTRWPPSRACWSGWPAARPSWPTPTWSCCRARGPRWPTWPGCASAGFAGGARGAGPQGPAGARASAAATRCWRREIDDEVESGAGRVAGLGLLPARVAFAADKTLGRPAGTAYGEPVRGYEIHHGVVTVTGAGRRAVPGRLPRPGRSGAPAGTARWRTTASAGPSWPRWPRWPGGTSGRRRTPASPGLREEQLDLLGDLVEEHLDTGRADPADRGRAAAPGCRSSRRPGRSRRPVPVPPAGSLAPG